VCLLSGRYPVDETMYARLPLDSRLTIRNIGDDRTAVLDGMMVAAGGCSVSVN
jgi:hypothetical protein